MSNKVEISSSSISSKNSFKKVQNILLKPFDSESSTCLKNKERSPRQLKVEADGYSLKEKLEREYKKKNPGFFIDTSDYSSWVKTRWSVWNDENELFEIFFNDVDSWISYYERNVNKNTVKKKGITFGKYTQDELSKIPVRVYFRINEELTNQDCVSSYLQVGKNCISWREDGMVHIEEFDKNKFKESEWKKTTLKTIDFYSPTFKSSCMEIIRIMFKYVHKVVYSKENASSNHFCSEVMKLYTTYARI